MSCVVNKVLNCSVPFPGVVYMEVATILSVK